MSRQYKEPSQVPTNVLSERLNQLGKMVSNNDFSDFSMRIPAELDRDADLVMCGSSKRLTNLQKERDTLVAEVERLKEEVAKSEVLRHKAELWDFLNDRIRSRSGIVLNDCKDCQDCATQWADAHDKAMGAKSVIQGLREQLNTPIGINSPFNACMYREDCQSLLAEVRTWIGDGENSDGMSREYWSPAYKSIVDKVDALLNGGGE